MDEWLSEALAYIASWLAFQHRDSGQPGCLVAVLHKGRVVFDHALGTANLTTGEALTPRHRFRVASHSKTFTAAGIMLLRERGLLGLDDALGRHLEGLHPEVGQATIAQVLSHSAGYTRDGMASGQYQDLRPFADTAEILADFAQAPTIERNTRFKYSNHGYALLGLVIEAITGESYAGWMRREIIAPASLDETAPDMPLAAGTPFARGHTGKLPLGERLAVPGDSALRAVAPAGGVVTTAADLVRFFAQLSPHVEASLLSVASRREMVRGQWKTPHATFPTTYGLGTVSGTLAGWNWFGHSGGLLGYVSRTIVVPDKALAVSVLVNGNDGPAWGWADGILHILKAFENRGAAARELRNWSGRWWGRGGVVDLLPMGDKVLITSPGYFNPLTDAAEITVEGPDTGRLTLANGYGSHGEGVRLVRDAAGKVIEFWIAGGRLVPEHVIAREMREAYDPARWRP